MKGKHSPWFRLCINSDTIYWETSLFLCGPHGIVVPHKKTSIVKMNYEVVVIFGIQFLSGVKPRRFHFVADIFSRLLNATKNLGVFDRTIDTSLILFQLEWLQEVHTYISTEIFPNRYSTKQQKKLVLKALPFTIIDGQLYKQRQDHILH